MRKESLRALIAICLLATFMMGQKIGDIASIIGVRDNQLIGYGLVVGLNGSGDKSSSKFTMQSIANMLETMNVKVSPNDIKSKNIAAVMVTATLPPFAKQGDKLNITVSSIGDAKSIAGGTLLLTPLSAVDGNIYAVAQGALSIGESGNVLAGNVLNGATVEREVPYDLYNKTTATLSLKGSDFQNAIRVQKVLNRVFGEGIAKAVDSRTIQLHKPEKLSMIEFLALVQEVEVDYSMREKVVIDERSGTIIAGVGITIEPIVITHGDITIKITQEDLSDPKATDIGDGTMISSAQNMISTSGKKPTVSSIVRALQKMGAGPKSIISILSAMKQSGAISADLEIV
ncbi:flagellar basal body P-ring protein FlgI [Helicobacter kayseriensis]|uniref:flagellar basal body P-ring protein FlgI n=1 Tax=Helicobacter kayseriensis TaxID=2905877 RepID=UPI001E59B783|nr:flagellar basal body P-ring protein FlgI [Helicobacter kayseriensis]MCE3047273.1 flagellar basal body P-ring protein FlgI [Helicobacter kayseriensis]MCE3048644.1 flagellar basal body P-ring protein FlgI [Helicobacter kayseriensis]